jgi:hypothetical protein
MPLTIDHSGGFANHGDLWQQHGRSSRGGPCGAFSSATRHHGGVAAITPPLSTAWGPLGAGSGSDIGHRRLVQYSTSPSSGRLDRGRRWASPSDFWVRQHDLDPAAQLQEQPCWRRFNLDGFDHNEPVFQWRTDTGGFTSDSATTSCEPPARSGCDWCAAAASPAIGLDDKVRGTAPGTTGPNVTIDGHHHGTGGDGSTTNGRINTPDLRP